MEALYRGMDRSALDRAYNNRAAVPGYAAIVEERKRRSERVRRSTQVHADLRYGPSPRERLDFFPAARADAPVLLFLHGGYWQSNDKEASSFLVEGPLSHGFAVALVEYTLAPEADMDRIVEEVGRAVEWLAGHASEYGGGSRLYVSGHSAGGHLAAMMLDRAGVDGVLAISGLFDLEPIRLCYLNEKLRLTPDAVERSSPLRRVPLASPPICITVGKAELPELVRQSTDYASALQRQKLPVRFLAVDGRDHFTILDELASPRGLLCLELARLHNAPVNA